MEERQDIINVVGVIPARYSSSRFEGKVLAEILGKPMIQHVWEHAQEALLLNDLIIARAVVLSGIIRITFAKASLASPFKGTPVCVSQKLIIFSPI